MSARRLTLFVERRVSRAAQRRAASPASCGRRNKHKHQKRAAQQAAGASRRLAV